MDGPAWRGHALHLGTRKLNIDQLRDTLYKKVRELHVQKYPYNDFLYNVEEDEEEQ